jgi:hypothetical protein
MVDYPERQLRCFLPNPPLSLRVLNLERPSFPRELEACGTDPTSSAPILSSLARSPLIVCSMTIAINQQEERSITLW